MELLKLEKVRDGKYLKNYEITYRNKVGKEKKYEIVSRQNLADAAEIGGKPSGVSIVATCQDKLLLLHEFRMASTAMSITCARECWSRTNPLRNAL